MRRVAGKTQSDKRYVLIQTDELSLQKQVISRLARCDDRVYKYGRMASLTINPKPSKKNRERSITEVYLIATPQNKLTKDDEYSIYH